MEGQQGDGVVKGGEGEAPLARWDNTVATSAAVTPLSLSTLLPSSTCHGEEKVSGTHGQENSGGERHTPDEVILEGSDAARCTKQMKDGHIALSPFWPNICTLGATSEKHQWRSMAAKRKNDGKSMVLC